MKRILTELLKVLVLNDIIISFSFTIIGLTAVFYCVIITFSTYKNIILQINVIIVYICFR